MSSDDTLGVRLRPEIVAVPAYRQGRPAPADGYKLSSNENPYPPLPSVVDAVAATLGELNRYPNAGGADLRARLAERHGVSVEQVHLGSGSVALLSQLISAAAGAGDEVVYSWRSFEAYPGLVTVAGATSVQVPNRPDGSHDLDALADAITDRTRVVIVCTPNNPTGTIVTAADFEAFMARVPSDLLVLLDEAYYEFVTDDAAVDGIPLLSRYPNLVVLRTFSKAYGLAALRIGYAVGPAAVLNAARSAAIPLSVTDASRVAALASIDAEDELMERVARIAMVRDRLRDALLEQGWAVPEAQGNFVWLATGEQTEAANDAFFDAGLTVRAFPPEGIRISVGEEQSVDKLLQVAADVVRNLPNGHPGKRLG
ncbi:pyridoxal phosphate-dependent aminotransferase [Leifsonia shinshuensis]|uniref:pyridoxal phosphate-dependent aminotransferase n=1 Tax=Leifsonia shinshuensis TaxID=150026 RepID=UPI00285A395E|nr:pyridoxal phosphate-dependent aminotransferase [Leifsonia shinshuensis]MDR6972300.1 histidinol-phosphate aminotransferase [Leifsonia shinshuensis]